MEPNKLHQEALVCDLHVDTLQRIEKGESFSGNGGHVDIPRMQSGGLNLQFFTAWVDPIYLAHDGLPDRSYDRTVALLDAFDREEPKHSEMQAVTSVSQAREAILHGKIAAALGIEGGHAIENSLDKLEEFFARGVRYLGLTWNNTTEWADAAKEETLHGTQHNGLTDFGERVVQRMNEMGMIVDLSHAAESTFWNVLNISKAPVMASHSNVHALNPHFRNLKDDQIRALADKHGLIGINFFCAFLDEGFARQREAVVEAHKVEFDALEAEHGYDYPTLAAKSKAILEREMGPHEVSATQIVDHMEYIIKLVGPDYVALGSDFDGTNALPTDVPDVAHLPRVTELMMQRGFSDSDIRKVLGENVLRFFDEVCG